METIPFRDRYGAHEVNGLPEGGQEALLDQMHEDGNVEVYWSDPQLAKITRLRFLTDRDFPYFDLSYCYGELKDGRTCRVQLPFGQLLKAKWKSQLIEYAKKDGVFAKSLGVFDADVMSYVN